MIEAATVSKVLNGACMAILAAIGAAFAVGIVWSLVEELRGGDYGCLWIILALIAVATTGGYLGWRLL